MKPEESERDAPVDIDTVEVVLVDEVDDRLDKLGAARRSRDGAREVDRVGPSSDGKVDFGVVAVRELDDALEDAA